MWWKPEPERASRGRHEVLEGTLLVEKLKKMQFEKRYPECPFWTGPHGRRTAASTLTQTSRSGLTTLPLPRGLVPIRRGQEFMTL